MAKKKTHTRNINKSAEIRAFLAANPGIKPRDAAEELAKKGVDVSAQYVSVVKSTSKSRDTSVATGSPTKNSVDQVSVNSMLQAKKLVDEVGGIEEAKLALNVLEQLVYQDSRSVH